MVSIIEFMDIENLNPARVILFAKAVNWDRSAPAIRLAADRYDTSFEQKNHHRILVSSGIIPVCRFR